MSVREMQQFLQQRGVRFDDCHDASELMARVRSLGGPNKVFHSWADKNEKSPDYTRQTRHDAEESGYNVLPFVMHRDCYWDDIDDSSRFAWQ
jgi:hypothetical protein